MKRFVFKLERLEQLRALRRREARAELARAIAELADRRREREAAQRELKRACEAHLPPHQTQDATRLKNVADWQGAARQALTLAEQREQEARRAVEQTEQSYVTSSRDHRVLERIRERRYQRWLNEVAVEEQKILDENFLLRTRP